MKLVNYLAGFAVLALSVIAINALDVDYYCYGFKDGKAGIKKGLAYLDTITVSKARGDRAQALRECRKAGGEVVLKPSKLEAAYNK